jgi:hypothetical protein
VAAKNPPAAAELSEREKWQAECAFREREVALAEAANTLKAEELKLKQRDQERSRWSSPLLITIGAATIAAVANFGIAWWNGVQQREVERTSGENQIALEERKAEQARILQMIAVNNPDLAAQNLAFLVQTRLIQDSGRRAGIVRYLLQRTPGTGASVAPAQGPAPPPAPAPIEQTEFSRISVEIYACESSDRAMRDLAARMFRSRPADWRARWREPKILPRTINARPEYGLSRIEVRYNPAEEQAANRLVDLIGGLNGPTANKVLTYFPSPGKISVFFCGGANP